MVSYVKFMPRFFPRMDVVKLVNRRVDHFSAKNLWIILVT